MGLSVKHIFLFLLYSFFQITLLNHMVLWDIATPFVFLLFLLMLPLTVSRPVLFTVTFFAGLIIDIFSQTYGLHTFGALLVIGLREYWIAVITSASFRSVEEIPLDKQSLIWYTTYLFPLIFVHHTAFFFLEAMQLENFLYTLLKIVGSSIYTFCFCFLICAIFYKK